VLGARGPGQPAAHLRPRGAQRRPALALRAGAGPGDYAAHDQLQPVAVSPPAAGATRQSPAKRRALLLRPLRLRGRAPGLPPAAPATTRRAAQAEIASCSLW